MGTIMIFDWYEVSSWPIHGYARDVHSSTFHPEWLYAVVSAGRRRRRGFGVGLATTVSIMCTNLGFMSVVTRFEQAQGSLCRTADRPSIRGLGAL